MKAVILAGGKGTRLKPYTTILPKPLMPIGDMPILEILLRQMRRAGVDEVVLTVGHLAELLRLFFQDGQRLGLAIRYSYEDAPLGTAGPLSLVEGLDDTFLVANGDVLTTLPLDEVMAHHRRSGATATIAMHRRQVYIDLGVIQQNDAGHVTGYIEKPTYDFMVSMGIYIFEPRVLAFIPRNEYLDFPDLVKRLIAAGEIVTGYAFDGYWQDLGRADDYERAVEDFDRMRGDFLPPERPAVLSVNGSRAARSGGGSRVMAEPNGLWRIPLADIDLGPEEEAAVLDVLRRRWLSMGGVTAAFEADFAALTGAAHALAVTNCTAALHLAGLALGWGPGDEVIVPSLTFVATANAVRYTGATPVFADVTSADDLSLSPADVAARLTPRTRAIIVVHYAGHAADMVALLALAERHGLDVVEDVAHAPGATLDGRALGAWGRIGCFSFFSNKNMTTGEGGMVTTDDDALAERLRLLRSHGMTTLTWDRHRGHAFSYDVVAPGYNYRIDELRAAIGRAQLAKLAGNNRRRAVLDEAYRALLPVAAPGLGLPYTTTRGAPAYHLRPVLLPPGADRLRFMAEMKARGIQTSIHYPPVHRFSYYRRDDGPTLPITDDVAAREVTLPLYPGLSLGDVEVVVAAAAEALAAAGGG